MPLCIGSIRKKEVNDIFRGAGKQSRAPVAVFPEKGGCSFEEQPPCFFG